MSLDKKIPLNQALQMVHDAYDQIEECSLEALKKSLYEVFGMGDTRFERLKAVYLERLGEAAQSRTEGFRKQARKRIGR